MVNRRFPKRAKPLSRAAKAWILLALVAIVTWLSGGFDAVRIGGRARAVDGDTIVLDGRRIRLVGLDAPEARQTCTQNGREWACGAEATKATRALVRAGKLDCRLTGTDIYGRDLGRCSVDGRDLGASLVEAGWAVATTAYFAEERRARGAKRGIWRGAFERPEDWRRDHGD